ncbi:CsbD-like [Frankineae bacterium MT45]|nr:CsbD-like [Frankineae bacterium MT45]
MSATDKVKNAVEDVEGKAKEAFGKVTGNHRTENEGKGDQAKADLKNAGENVKDAFKH